MLAFAGGAISGTAGCTQTTLPVRFRRLNQVPDTTETEPTVCRRPVHPGVIPAITRPSFHQHPNPTALHPSTLVIGITRNGDARAYPVPLLTRYEIVNDTFELPVLITYCPVCNSGLTAIRRVNGHESIFGNTGYTWQPPESPSRESIESGRVFGIRQGNPSPQAAPTIKQNLVFFDQTTESRWSQLLAQAICGPREGDTLSIIPSTVTQWRTWRDRHPHTKLLQPPPQSLTMRPARHYATMASKQQ